MMRWGLVPYWAKDPSIGLRTINAKAETITTTPAFREAIKYRRCLVPADAFYEWVRPESRPDDCPAWSRDRTCRPIGSTLGGQAVRQRTVEKPSENVTAAARLLSEPRGELRSASIEADRGQGLWHGQHMRTLVKASTRKKEPKMLTGSEMQWVRRFHSPPSWAKQHCRCSREGLNHICHRNGTG
jgi:hypothetical protein